MRRQCETPDCTDDAVVMGLCPSHAMTGTGEKTPSGIMDRIATNLPPLELYPWQRALFDAIQEAMNHRGLYGCSIEVGFRLGGNGWRCKAGPDCPQIRNPLAPKEHP